MLVSITPGLIVITLRFVFQSSILRASDTASNACFDAEYAPIRGSDMGYGGETNDVNFSSGTTAFYGFLGFLINGESTNGASLAESNVQMPFSPGTISLLWCRVTTAASSSIH